MIDALSYVGIVVVLAVAVWVFMARPPRDEIDEQTMRAARLDQDHEGGAK